MRTALGHESDIAILATEQNELLAEQGHRYHRFLVQFHQSSHRMPEIAHVVASGRARTDLRQTLPTIILTHLALPLCSWNAGPATANLYRTSGYLLAAGAYNPRLNVSPAKN